MRTNSTWLGRLLRGTVTTAMTVACWGLSLSTSAWACPSCKLLADQQSEVPRAYMLSIFFMLGMIAAVTGSVIYVLYRLHKYECLQLEEAGYGHLFDNAVSPVAGVESAGS